MTATENFNIGNQDILEVIAGRYFANLKIPDQRQVNVFKEYLKFINFLLYTPNIKRVLELGGGYSTLLLANLARLKGFELHCVDWGFNEKMGIIKGTPYEEILKTYVRLHEGISIAAKDMQDAYQAENINHGADVSAPEFKNQLSFFIRNNEPRKWIMMERVIGRSLSHEEAVNLFFKEEAFSIPREILEGFKDLASESQMIKEMPGMKTGLLRALADRVENFDVVFFDCGELSSWIEWQMLGDKIRIGGIAAFHDIFFPKSFKNFIVCASVLASNRWIPLYMDQATPQGFLIAQRVA